MRAKSLPARPIMPGDRRRCCAVVLWHVIIMETPPSPELKAGLLSVQMHLLCWFSWINTSTHIPGWRIEWEGLTESERRERKKVTGCIGSCWMLMVGTSVSGADVIYLVQKCCDPADTPWTNSHTTDVAMPIKETENHAVQPLVKT